MPWSGPGWLAPRHHHGRTPAFLPGRRSLSAGPEHHEAAVALDLLEEEHGPRDVLADSAIGCPALNTLGGDAAAGGSLDFPNKAKVSFRPEPVEEPSVPESAPVPDPPVPVPSRAVRAGSIVPVWRPALSADALTVDYQRILSVLAEHRAGGEGVMSCQEISAALGLAPVPAGVEGVRSKMKRLADRGWAVEPSPGRFTLAAGPAAGS
ncbi:hypothetical protein [Streptomyces klenkii]